MAFLLKKLFQVYFYMMDEVADPRANDYLLMESPVPTFIILLLWYQFIFKWGPNYMKNREPFNIKRILMVYNIVQVFCNAYILYYLIKSSNVINWSCAGIDYSDSYWSRKHLSLSHKYYLLKLADLVDTIFFVLRKKSSHVSFLHTYHHFMMPLCSWAGVKFLGGGHSYFLGLANCTVHTVLYLYYFLTSYDSKYAKIIWMKKFITQLQLLQFVFLFWSYAKLLFVPKCDYPKYPIFIFIPQNFFMIVLFGDFYIKTYILAPRRKRKMEELAKKEKEEAENAIRGNVSTES